MYDPVGIMSERLIIKEADSTDLDTLLNLWSNPEVMRLAGYPSPQGSSLGDVESWWRDYQFRRTEGPWERQFVIKLKDGPFIGESGWSKIDDPGEIRGFDIEPRLITVITDIKLDPNYWGLGYAPEAMKELLWWAYDEAGVDVILVLAHRKNEAAKKAYEKCGFKDTGFLAKGEYRIFSLSKEEADY